MQKRSLKRARSVSNNELQQRVVKFRRFQEDPVMPKIPASTDERKYLNDLDSFNITTANQICRPMSNIPGGNGVSQRVGNKVNLTGLQMRWEAAITQDPSDPITNDIVRVIVFYDRSSNGVVPTNTQVLDSATVISNYRIDNMKRFRVLYDKSFVLDGAGPTRIIKKKWIKINTQATYLGNTANQTDMNTGQIYYMVLSYNNAGGITAFQLDYKLRFTDP